MLTVEHDLRNILFGRKPVFYGGKFYVAGACVWLGSSHNNLFLTKGGLFRSLDGVDMSKSMLMLYFKWKPDYVNTKRM